MREAEAKAEYFGNIRFSRKQLSAFDFADNKKLPEVWRVSVKQLQSRQQCLPELFLHILKPYDMIKQTDKSVFVGVSDGNY